MMPRVFPMEIVAMTIQQDVAFRLLLWEVPVPTVVVFGALALRVPATNSALIEAIVAWMLNVTVRGEIHVRETAAAMRKHVFVTRVALLTEIVALTTQKLARAR